MEIVSSRSSADWKGKISGVEAPSMANAVEAPKAITEDRDKESVGSVAESVTIGERNEVADGVVEQARERIGAAVAGTELREGGVETVSRDRDVVEITWTNVVIAISAVVGTRAGCVSATTAASRAGSTSATTVTGVRTVTVKVGRVFADRENVMFAMSVLRVIITGGTQNILEWTRTSGSNTSKKSAAVTRKIFIDTAKR